MKSFKIIYGLGFASSIVLLFRSCHYFQVGNNYHAFFSLIIGVVCGIGNFKALVEE